MVAESSSQASSVGAGSFDSGRCREPNETCPHHELEITSSIGGHREGSETFAGSIYERPDMHVEMSVDIKNDFRCFHAIPYRVVASPNPLPGQDTHGAEQGSY
jgi:hypothetical protein